MVPRPFQPEKAPHGAAGCLFGARRGSCLARSISDAYQVATKAPGRGSRMLARASERVQPCSHENSRQRTHGNSAMAALPVSTPQTCGAKRLAPDNEMTDKI